MNKILNVLKKMFMVLMAGATCVGLIVGSVTLIGYIVTLVSGTAFEYILSMVITIAAGLAVVYCVGVVVLLIIQGTLMGKQNLSTFQQKILNRIDDILGE